MTQLERGPVPLPVSARYSVPLRVRVRGNQWRCGRWPGQAGPGPLKGPCQWAGARLPETAARGPLALALGTTALAVAST